MDENFCFINCDPNYYMRGQSTDQCQADDTRSPSNPPLCIRECSSTKDSECVVTVFATNVNHSYMYASVKLKIFAHIRLRRTPASNRVLLKTWATYINVMYGLATRLVMKTLLQFVHVKL